MAEFVVVGSEECPVRKVVEILRKSEAFRQFPELWRDFSLSLHLPVEKIKKFKHDLNLEKSSLAEIAYEIISTWVSENGTSSTLDKLIKALIANKLKEVTDLLTEEYVGVLGRNRFQRYCCIPVEIETFLSTDIAESNNGGNVCIVRTLDTLITKQKLQENLKKAVFYEFVDYINLVSSGHICNPYRITVITDIKQTDLEGFIADIDRKEIVVKGRLLVLTDEKCLRSVDLVSSSQMKTCRDDMKWSDLTVAFKRFIRDRLSEIVKIDKDIENDLLMGDALVHLINENYSYLNRSLIPELGSIYINRTLISRNVLNRNQLFYDLSPVIFVFNGLSKIDLTGFVSITKIENSQQQLRQITSKFIILDNVNHFSQLCLLTKNPMHLIDYEGGRFIFKKSRGSIKIVQDLVDQLQMSYSEVEFSLMIVKLVRDNAPICISDSPGMGKSVLLNKIGQKLRDLFPERRVFFLLMSNLINMIKRKQTLGLAIAIKESLQAMICQCELEKVILMSQIDSSNFEIELMLDGLDEVNPSYLGLALDSIKIMKSWPSTRLWVSTRPHLLHNLEEALETLGYNISPFTEEDQVFFLKSFWKSSTMVGDMADSSETKLVKFAQQCLISLKESITESEKDIAGIPLQCLLIGEVYEEEAFQSCSLEGSEVAKSVRIKYFSELYSKLMDKKYKFYKEKHPETNHMNKDEMFLSHAEFAQRLLFPAQYHLLWKHFQLVCTMTDILNVGILENTSNSTNPVFVHRTFAEYFAAWLFLNLSSKKTHCDAEMEEFLEEFLKCNDVRVDLWGSYLSSEFVHPNVLYFLDSLIATASAAPHLELELYWRNVAAPTLQNAVKACVHKRLFHLGKTFLKCQQFQKRPSPFYEELVLLSARYSNFDLLYLALALIKEQEQNWEEEQVTKTLRLTVIGGNASGFQYLMTCSEYRRLVEWPTESTSTLLHDCVKSSYQDPHNIVANKIKIVTSLLQINQALLEMKDVSGNTSILCELIHPDLFVLLINEGANAEVQSYDQNTILHFASAPRQYHQTLERIPTNNLQNLVHFKNKNGETPLQSLLQHGDPLPETLQIFMDQKADFNVIDRNKHSLLSLAIKSGRNEKTIHKLVQCGADVKCRTRFIRKNLLHKAAQSGNLGVMKYLVNEHKMSLNLNDRCLNTPMDYAVKFFRNRKIKGVTKSSILRFVEEKKNPKFLPHQSSKEGSLHTAVINNDLKALQMLLKLGLDANLVDGDGNSPLHLAIKLGADPMLEHMLDHGANVNVQNNDGQTSLHLAAQKGNDSTVKLLIDFGADVNVQNNEGSTPLHLAAQHRKHSTVKLLIEIGADVNVQENHELSPLHWAAIGENDLLVKLLIDIGVDVNVQNKDGFTPLHWAAQHGKYLTVKLLIDSGADVNVLNNTGNTPLHTAASSVWSDYCTVKCLIDHGANANLQNKDGKIPLRLASEKNNSSRVKLLTK